MHAVIALLRQSRKLFLYLFLPVRWAKDHAVCPELLFVIGESFDAYVGGAQKAVPRVLSPAATPPNENFRGLPFRSATIHRIGRMNRAPSRPVQVMDRGQERSWTIRGRISERIASVARPRLTWRAARYSPFGVCTKRMSCSAMPCFSAKLTAARVGAPTESYATDLGGPVISWTTSAWRVGNPQAQSTSRRGVLKVSTVTPLARLSAAISFSKLSFSSSSARGSMPAGISSHPISNSNSTRSSGFFTFPALLGPALMGAPRILVPRLSSAKHRQRPFYRLGSERAP